MSDTCIRVFVNDRDEGDDTVTLQLVNPGIMEIDGELWPVIEVTPQGALDLAQALVDCGHQIVKRQCESGEAEEPE